tara:strand:+ start:54 stop:587 length:534 start_codon:yes stop_codon:yes gene_type:complete
MGYKQKENPITMSEDHKMAYDRSEINRLKGDIHADDVNKHRGSWMSKHSKSALNYGSPLHKDKTGDELKQEGKDLKQEGRDKKKEGRDKKKEGRELRRKERTVKYGERQLKSKLAANQKQIDKDEKSKELTVMPVDDGNMGNVTGKTKTKTKTKTVTKVDGKRTVVKEKNKNKNKNK